MTIFTTNYKSSKKKKKVLVKPGVMVLAQNFTTVDTMAITTVELTDAEEVENTTIKDWPTNNMIKNSSQMYLKTTSIIVIRV